MRDQIGRNRRLWFRLPELSGETSTPSLGRRTARPGRDSSNASGAQTREWILATLEANGGEMTLGDLGKADRNRASMTLRALLTLTTRGGPVEARNGNYFRLRSMAEAARKRVLSLLRAAGGAAPRAWLLQHGGTLAASVLRDLRAEGAVDVSGGAVMLRREAA